MSKDLYNRDIDYLRLAVTSRCNYTCSFCAPKNYDCYFEPEAELLDEEILHIVSAATGIGFKKIRLTGGEPLLRPGIVSLIKKIKDACPNAEVTLTTNGSPLCRMVPELYRAGIRRLNVNLPSIDRARYMNITGADLLTDVMTGIELARSIGMGIKINIVTLSDLSYGEVIGFSNFAARAGLEMRFIEYMALGHDPMTTSLPIDTLRMWLRKGNITAEIIASMDQPFCGRCNRLRISASGEIFPCLFGSPSHDLTDVVKREPENITNVLLEAISFKPYDRTGAATDELYRPAIRAIGG